VFALLETVSYLTLFYFWVIRAERRREGVRGFFHGLIWMAFVG